jgi:hypothetical protein
MKVTAHIFETETGKEIATFTTSSKNIQKAVYSYINRNYHIYKVCATETYYKLSN